MRTDRGLRRYRRLYAALLRLYPEPFRGRFAAGMEQTFHDLCREQRAAGRGLFAFALGLFVETSAGILRERTTVLMPPRRNVIRLTLITAAVLLVPLVASRFTDGVDWTAFDYVAAGVLLFGTGLGFEIVARRGQGTAYRLASGVAFAAGLMLVWANLAVGLIGSEDNPANALYLGVLCIAVAGAGLARLRPRAMARALYATAAAQALVPVVALLIFRPLDPGAAGLVGVFMINAFFVTLFALSGILFGVAGEAGARTR